MDDKSNDIGKNKNASEPTQRKRRRSQQPTPPKLKLLFLIVPRQKAELYSALVQPFNINAELILSARGTANSEMLEYLGLSDSDKAVIVCAVREDKCSAVIKYVEEKFRTVKNGKGIAFTVPMSSIVGVESYKFLSDQQ